MTGGKPRKRTIKAPLTLEQARADVLAKLTKAGPKGTASPITAKTAEPNRTLLAQALTELEAERAIFVDGSGAKPKYFLAAYAPSAAVAAAKMEQAAALKHPALRKATELKKALAKLEQPLFAEALALLESNRRLLRLIHGKSVVFAHGDSLRAMLGASPRAETPRISAEAIRRPYAELVQRTGFPEVEVAALQRAAGVPLDELKSWLLAEHTAGRANFATGDWSLSSDAARAGVIELHGERYLLVRLKA